MSILPIVGSLVPLLGPPLAQWPTDPASPLSIGAVPGVGMGDPAVAVGPDGATWTAWVDTQCFGALLVQRVSRPGTLLPGGALTLHVIDVCTTPEPRLAACSDGTVVVSGATPEFSGGPLPVQRLDGSGAPLWGPGITPVGLETGALAHLAGLPGGDALVVWVQAGTMHVQRYSIEGDPRWPSPTMISSVTGANFRVLGTVDDGEGGVFLAWDAPLTYTRTLRVTRVASDGAVPWPTPLHVTAATPSSRHTPPALAADGSGGLWVAWTQGAESDTTPVPLRLQRISAAGALAFEAQGLRVTTLDERQFDARLVPHLDHVHLAWRHDQVGAHVRAQAVSAAGERLLGDEGVGLGPLASPLARLDAAWNADALSVVVADPVSGSATLRLWRVDEGGGVAVAAAPLSGPTPVDALAVRGLGPSLVVTWMEEGEALLAQRVNPDGSLGRRRPPIRGR